MTSRMVHCTDLGPAHCNERLKDQDHIDRLGRDLFCALKFGCSACDARTPNGLWVVL